MKQYKLQAENPHCPPEAAGIIDLTNTVMDRLEEQRAMLIRSGKPLFVNANGELNVAGKTTQLNMDNLIAVDVAERTFADALVERALNGGKAEWVDMARNELCAAYRSVASEYTTANLQRQMEQWVGNLEAFIEAQIDYERGIRVISA